MQNLSDVTWIVHNTFGCIHHNYLKKVQLTSWSWSLQVDQLYPTNFTSALSFIEGKKKSDRTPSNENKRAQIGL